MPIQNVSDTARWVAVYRAMESERPDAHFRDPFARRLAGARGEEIVANMKRGRSSAWAMIVRTQVIDELVRRAVHDGADTIVNLAAGLDARPWRLDLPPTLRWVDVDLPGILRYKAEVIGEAEPVCGYETIAADLTDVAVRDALFAQLGASSRHAVVISEGLLIYLSPEQVGSLAEALHAVPSMRQWIIDLASPRLVKWMEKSWGKDVAKGNAPFRFAPEEGTEFFRAHGWREAEFRSTIEEARRLGREAAGARLFRLIARFQGSRARDRMRRLAGVVRLVRNES